MTANSDESAQGPFNKHISNSRFELQTAIDNLTIQELGEILGFVRGVRYDLLTEPFPHISVITSYGEITLFDTDKGWLERRIEIREFSIRCLFCSSVQLSDEQMLKFNEQCKEHEILLRDGDRYIFQTSLRIMPMDTVKRLLDRLLVLSERCAHLVD